LTRYILKRVFFAFVTVCIVFTVVFMLLRFMPTSGYFPREMINSLDEGTKNAYLRSIGLLDPPFVQLKNFVIKLFRGDLGRSITVYPKVPIVTILAEKIPVSAAFGFASLVFGMAAGLLLGMFMVRFKSRFGDNIGTAYVIAVRSIPSLIYFFLIQVWVSKALKLPLVYYNDRFLSWILPVICLSLGSIAWYAIWLRRFMVDEENKDYVKFARVKGLSQKYILRKHIFRNAIIPLAIYLPSDLLFIISGSLIIESLFVIPGTGGLLTTAIRRQDNTLVQVLVLMYSAMSVAGVLLGDLLAAFVDPRIKLTEKED